MNTKFYEILDKWNVRSLPRPLLITQNITGDECAEMYGDQMYIPCLITANIPRKKVRAYGCIYLEYPELGDCMVVDEEIDLADSPENAFYSKAFWAWNGEPLTDEQLNALTEKWADKIYEKLSGINMLE